MKTTNGCDTHQTIARLNADILRIRQAQKFIARADRALKAGRDEVLRAMGFGHEHIEELKRNVAQSSTSAFPRHVRRNNAVTVGFLRREIERLQRQVCSCPEANGDGSHAENEVCAEKSHSM